MQSQRTENETNIEHSLILITFHDGNDIIINERLEGKSRRCVYTNLREYLIKTIVLCLLLL